MSKLYGTFVTVNPDGSATSSKVKYYNTYSDMVDDKDPGLYGIVNETNQVYHRSGDQWIIGFPNVLRDDDYTAFEVFAHDYDIPVGESEDLSGYVSETLPAELRHQFYIRSKHSNDEQDIIIDWGDGTINDIRDFYDTGVSKNGEYRYNAQHTYNTTGKYIVKIYGTTYFGIIHGASTKFPNILSRALDMDLPVAQHLTNFSSFCKNSFHLLNVNVSRCNNFNKNYSNISNMFYGCKNLQHVIGFAVANKVNCSYSSVFSDCVSLIECDLQISNTDWIMGLYSNCGNLNFDISTLLYYFNVNGKLEISASSTFNNCKLMIGTVPADKLWDNKDVIWTDTDNCFTGCSDEIRAQVPTSWGGTASDDIIAPSISEQIAEQNARIAALEAQLELG